MNRFRTRDICIGNRQPAWSGLNRDWLTTFPTVGLASARITVRGFIQVGHTVIRISTSRRTAVTLRVSRLVEGNRGF